MYQLNGVLGFYEPKNREINPLDFILSNLPSLFYYSARLLGRGALAGLTLPSFKYSLINQPDNPYLVNINPNNPCEVVINSPKLVSVFKTGDNLKDTLFYCWGQMFRTFRLVFQYCWITQKSNLSPLDFLLVYPKAYSALELDPLDFLLLHPQKIQDIPIIDEAIIRNLFLQLQLQIGIAKTWHLNPALYSKSEFSALTVIEYDAVLASILGVWLWRAGAANDPDFFNKLLLLLLSLKAEWKKTVYAYDAYFRAN